MLIPLPVGLWVFSLVADIVYRAGGGPAWAAVAYYDLLGGIVGALLAAVFGFIDFTSIPNSRPREIALYHMGLNLTIVVLQIASFWMRAAGVLNATPFVLSIIAVGLLTVSGWLGWEMVYRYGIGIDAGVAIKLEERARAGRGAA